MTLGIAVVTNNFAVMASDRRLTIGTKVATDSQDKMCVIVTDDARAVISFSGMAKVGSFNFHGWLVEKLSQCAQPDFQLPKILERLKEKLENELFNDTEAKSVRNKHRPLSIHIAGFRYIQSIPRITGVETLPFYMLLSNYEKLDGTGDLQNPMPIFELTLHLPASGATQCKLCGAIGNTGAISGKEIEYIRENAHLMSQRDVALKLNATIMQSSKALSAQNNIGGKITTVVVPANLHEPIISDFHSDEPSFEYYHPASVYCTSSAGFTIFNARVRYGGENPRAVVVQQVGRKKPCPCGSGMRYADCHGKPPH